MKSAREKQIQNTEKNIAKKLLKGNYTIDKIVRLTELSKDQVKNLLVLNEFKTYNTIKAFKEGLSELKKIKQAEE